MQTLSRTTFLKTNSPVKFQAIGSVDRLHFTTPGVVTKNDQVIAKLTMPISEPAADRIGLNAPAASSAAMANSVTPRTYASPFMGGETEYASSLVERFTCYHRRSYVCKTGVGDALIGAAATIADYNGVERASHIKDKLVEMTHLNETIYGTGIAASHQGVEMRSGAYLPDEMR